MGRLSVTTAGPFLPRVKAGAFWPCSVGMADWRQQPTIKSDWEDGLLASPAGARSWRHMRRHAWLPRCWRRWHGWYGVAPAAQNLLRPVERTQVGADGAALGRTMSSMVSRSSTAALWSFSSVEGGHPV